MSSPPHCESKRRFFHRIDRRDEEEKRERRKTNQEKILLPLRRRRERNEKIPSDYKTLRMLIDMVVRNSLDALDEDRDIEVDQ
jgi:hypothetical protein